MDALQGSAPPYSAAAPVTKAFNPRAVEETRRQITQIASQLIDRIEGSQFTDVINDFAFPLPVAVIARVLGLREPHRERPAGSFDPSG